MPVQSPQAHGPVRRVPTALLLHLARDLRTAMDRELAPLDVTPQQAMLLLHSSAGSQVSSQRLCSVLGIDAAGMTRLVDRLEAKGLAGRRDNLTDRRSVLVEATERGRALAPLLGAARERVQARALEGFTEQETDQLTQFALRMIANLARDGSRC